MYHHHMHLIVTLKGFSKYVEIHQSPLWSGNCTKTWICLYVALLSACTHIWHVPVKTSSKQYLKHCRLHHGRLWYLCWFPKVLYHGANKSEIGLLHILWMASLNICRVIQTWRSQRVILVFKIGNWPPVQWNISIVYRNYIFLMIELKIKTTTITFPLKYYRGSRWFAGVL